MAYLNTLKISQNTGLILNLQNEINDLSGSVINYQPQIDDLSASILVLDGQVASIASAVNIISDELDDVQQDVIDLSSEIITLTNEVDSNTAQISLNTGAISIIGGEIDTLETNVEDLSSQVLDLSTNTAKLNADNTFTENNIFQGDKQFVVNITGSATSAISFSGRDVIIQDGLLCGNGPTAHVDAKISGVLSVNQTAQGGTDDRALNYITTPKVEITTEPVDLSDATTKNYVDNAIAGVVINDTSFARLDISNTFVSKQTFLDTINAEKVVADKFFTDNNGEELVYGNYSNTFYVNDGETGTSGSINDTLALITSQDKIIRISLGSYGAEDVLVSGKTLLGISCPNVGGVTMTELGGTRTFTIENSLRVRVSGLQINGMTTISGSQLQHRLEVCNFNGGLTITGGGVTPLAEFMTIQDCEVSGSLTISSFTGIVYFYRVNFNNATFNISPAYSPQQVIMIDCAGIPDDARLFAGNYFAVGLTSFYKSGSLTIADLNPAYYVRDTTPSQDNELTSKIYVDSAVATNTSAIANNTAIIAGNSTAISQLQGLLDATDANVATNTANISNNANAISTNTSNIATNTSAISTNTTDIATNTDAIITNTSAISTNTTDIATNTNDISDLSANKQDVLIAGTGIEIVGTTISAGIDLTNYALLSGTNNEFINSNSFLGPSTTIEGELICSRGNDYPFSGVNALISGVLTVNQGLGGFLGDRLTNYITTLRVILTTEPVDLTDATTKNYVDNAIATNTSAISTNTSNISTLQGLVNTNTTNISTNTSAISTNTSAISTNTSNISTNTTGISTLQGLVNTNTSAISTNTSDISDLNANKQDLLIAGTNITIVGTTISSTGGGGGGSSIEIFQASMVRDSGTTALSNNDNLPFAIIDKETSGLTMSASNGEITFGGSNVAGTYEIKYSLVASNVQSTTARVIIRGYVNNVWVVEFGKLSGLLENGSFTYDFVSGDVLKFTVIGLQSSNQLLLATGLTTETYASCFLTGIKLI